VYHWEFGDGETTVSTVPTVEHTYAAGGSYPATLRVVDTNGVSTAVAYTGHGLLRRGGPSAVTTHPVTIIGPANVGLSVQPTSPSPVVGDTITFQGVLLDPGNAPLAGRTLHFDDPGGATYGSATSDAGGFAVLTRSDLPIGSYTAIARFEGEAGVAAPATSQPVAFEVVEQPAALDLDVDPAAPDADDPVTLVAAIDAVAAAAAASVADPEVTPAAIAVCTGTVDFTLDGQPAGSATVTSADPVSVDLPAQAVGQHVAGAAYTPDDGCVAATASLTFSVVQVPTPPEPPPSTSTTTTPPSTPTTAAGQVGGAGRTGTSRTTPTTTTALARTGSSSSVLAGIGLVLIGVGLELRRRAALVVV
jgi:PKD repeat protein